MSDTTYDQLVTIVEDLHDAPSEALSPDASFADLGVDSLTMVEIALRVERTLGIDVADNELTEDLSLEQAAKVIEAKRPEGRG